MTRWSFREDKSATDMYSTDTVTLIFIGGRSLEATVSIRMKVRGIRFKYKT